MSTIVCIYSSARLSCVNKGMDNPGMNSGMNPGMNSGMNPGMNSGMNSGMKRPMNTVTGRELAGAEGFQPSLPLFGEPLSAIRSSRNPSPEQARPVGGSVPQINPHLVAARKLARRMRRLKARPDEQTRTGQAICHHLKALLTETQG